MKAKKINEVRRPWGLIFGLLLAVTGCLVPNNAYLMELNRSGKWREAEKVGLAMLDNRDKFSHGEISETYYHVIYAKIRLKKSDEAAAYVKQYDEWSGREPLPSERLWLIREMQALKYELELLTPEQKDLIGKNIILMSLNRRGEWAEAEKQGVTFLTGQPAPSPGETAETYYHVILARTRLGKTNEAAAAVEQWNAWSERQPLPVSLAWVYGEIFKLQDELGLLTVNQKALLRAMDENGKKNYRRAIELCREVIAGPDATERQKATAYFISAVCSLRTGDREEAEAKWAAYEKLKSVLPPGDPTRQQEASVRSALEKLKQTSGM